MENAIGALVGSSVVAALFATAVIAYRHPEAYRGALFPILSCAGGAGLFLALLWDISSTHTYTKLAPYIDPGKSTQAIATVNASIINRQAVPVCIILLVYLGGLRLLPILTAKEIPATRLRDEAKEKPDKGTSIVVSDHTRLP